MQFDIWDKASRWLTVKSFGRKEGGQRAEAVHCDPLDPWCFRSQHLIQLSSPTQQISLHVQSYLNTFSEFCPSSYMYQKRVAIHKPRLNTVIYPSEPRRALLSRDTARRNTTPSARGYVTTTADLHTIGTGHL